VNKGRGFVPADQHVLPKHATVDLVRIDSIYNPVRRANFEVEATRVGERTDFDRLTLQIETDGSTGPVEAVEYAAELVKKHMDYFGYFSEGSLPVAPKVGSVAVPDQLQELFGKEIDDLVELTVRSRNSLKKARISQVGELVRRTKESMMAIENFGERSLEEIEKFLEEHGLRLGMAWAESEDGKLYFVDEEGGGTAG